MLVNVVGLCPGTVLLELRQVRACFLFLFFRGPGGKEIKETYYDEHPGPRQEKDMQNNTVAATALLAACSRIKITGNTNIYQMWSIWYMAFVYFLVQLCVFLVRWGGELNKIYSRT